MAPRKEPEPPITPVKALAMPEIPRRLQQVMGKHKAMLEKSQMWEFLLWTRDVEKVVYETKVTQFVHTYNLKTKLASVGTQKVDFSTAKISQVLNLPNEGAEIDALPILQRAEAEEIFDYKFKWGKESKWHYESARQQWKAWFDFVNTYLLFRPDEHQMEHKYVVAAIRTWEGHTVNWAKVVQYRINEEIQERKAHPPPVIYLYSAFYISCLCEAERTWLKITTPKPSTSRGPLSPPSPTLGELEVEMAKTKLKLAELQKQVIEKQDKMEVIQERNAEYLQQVNQLLKEKFADQRRFDQLQAENATLKAQIVELKEEQTRRIPTPTVIEVPVVAARPVMVDKSCNTVESMAMELSTEERTEQPTTSTEPTNWLPLEVCTRLWEIETKIYRDVNLHQIYEIHRDLLFVMVGLEMGDILDRIQFQTLWAWSEGLTVENLLVEIVARKHLILTDPFSAFVEMGDVGGRIYLYYAGEEEKLQQCKGVRRNYEERIVDWSDYATLMADQFYSQTAETMDKWKANLERVLALVKDEEYLTVVLGGSLQRVYNHEGVEDFTASHYVYNRERSIERIHKYLRAITVKRAPALDVQVQVQFPVAPPDYNPRYLSSITLPMGGSAANQRYLGNFGELFDDEDERPVPTWKALTWLLEDYGLSRTETVAADLVYRQSCGPWSFEPPPAVKMHPQFCPCARRHKWAPNATVASVEYNWPQIQGAPGFNTPAQCREAYQRFHEEHRTHKDPVCFRAAVFCAALADWCPRWNFAINVNSHHVSRPEFWMLLKLQYRPARWIRLVETMAITHFIEGVHPSLINEFPYSRCGPFERFLKWQRKHNPQAMVRDEDLRRAMLRLEFNEPRQGVNRSQSQDEDDDGESSVKKLKIGRDANQ